MKEESRIEALEHELKILKNEIQATLLEIREQVLNHYYPELRAEEPLRSHSLPVRQPVGRPGIPQKAAQRSEEPTNTLSEIAAKGQMQPFSDIFLEDLSDDEQSDDDIDSGENEFANHRHAALGNLDGLRNGDFNDSYDEDDELDDGELDDDELDDDDDIHAALTEAVSASQAEIEPSDADEPVSPRTIVAGQVNHSSPTPTTREVDFRKLKQASAAPTANVKVRPVKAREYAREEVQIAPTPKTTPMNMATLAGWVSDGIARVGKERTLQIIETYATGGKLSEATKNSLMQMISLTDDAEPETPVGSRDMLTLMVELDQILDQ